MRMGILFDSFLWGTFGAFISGWYIHEGKNISTAEFLVIQKNSSWFENEIDFYCELCEKRNYLLWNEMKRD